MQKGQPYEICAGDFISFGDAHLAKFEAVMTTAGMRPPKRSAPARQADDRIVDVIKAGLTAAEQIANAVASASASASTSSPDSPPAPPPPPPTESFDDAPLAELPDDTLEEQDPKTAVEDVFARGDCASNPRIVLAPSEWSDVYRLCRFVFNKKCFKRL